MFNGSMLPAAGAAPGQAGPPARPQPPRSHQLQLQLRALRLPASPAALAGNRRPGARTPRLSAFVFSWRDSGHCSGLCRLVCPSLDGQPFTLGWAQCPRTLRPPPAASPSRPRLAPAVTLSSAPFSASLSSWAHCPLAVTPSTPVRPRPLALPPHLRGFACLAVLRWSRGSQNNGPRCPIVVLTPNCFLLVGGPLVPGTSVQS